jgi:hypothetical protein
VSSTDRAWAEVIGAHYGCEVRDYDPDDGAPTPPADSDENPED